MTLKEPYVLNLDKEAKLDAEEMYDAQWMALIAIGSDTVSFVEIMRVLLVANEANGMGYQFYQGYCDDIEEAIGWLHEIGAIKGNRLGLRMTDYGRKMYAYAPEYAEELYTPIIHAKTALYYLTPRQLVAVSARYYDCAANPNIACSVNPLIDRIRINETPLREYNKSMFEFKVRSGIALRISEVC